MPPPYDLGRRADAKAETRRQITEAAVALHSTVGPAKTTISAIDDPRRRVITALTAIYGWYRANAGMIGNTERDAPELPALAQVADPSAYLDPVKQLLGPPGQRAALGHALAFSTWRSLTREGLSDHDAAALIARIVA
jgi:hypothetical protein